MKIKTCPICGKEFPCYADEDGRTCWCESFPKINIDDALDCLCPDCLADKVIEQGYSQNEISTLHKETIGVSMKILVVYYSLDGNTKYLAECIAESVGADVLRLMPVKDIKNNKMKYFFGGKQASLRTKPELQSFDVDIIEYDLIIIGTPVWAFTMAPAVRSFLNKVELKDKKIGLFSCHRGGRGKAITHMKELLDGNEILSTTNFQEPIKGEQDKKEQICSWAQNLIETVKSQ